MTLETQTIATLKAMQSRLLNLRQPKMTRLCVVFVQPRCHLEQLQLDVGGLFESRSPPPTLGRTATGTRHSTQPRLAR
jgi:hypothetical protein